MAHENYQEMLAAQALNALDAEEARVLNLHLKSCSDCRLQLSRLEETAAALAFVAIDEKTSPSAELRDRIIEAARADAPDAIETRGTTRQNPRASFTNVASIRDKRSNQWNSVQRWSAIAASLLLVVLASSLLVLWRQNRQAQLELTRLSNQVHEAQQQLAQQRDAIEIISAPGTRMMELAGTSVMPGAHAMLAFDKRGRAILMAKGLPPPPQGKAYQLWFIAGDRPMPGKVFSTDATGGGMLSDQVPVEALSAAVFAVTLEDAQGVKVPTGAMFLKSGA